MTTISLTDSAICRTFSENLPTLIQDTFAPIVMACRRYQALLERCGIPPPHPLAYRSLPVSRTPALRRTLNRMGSPTGSNRPGFLQRTTPLERVPRRPGPKNQSMVSLLRHGAMPRAISLRTGTRFRTVNPSSHNRACPDCLLKKTSLKGFGEGRSMYPPYSMAVLLAPHHFLLSSD